MSLVGLEGGFNVTRLSRFANYLRSILPHSDVTLTEMTAKAIGQLALAEGTYTAEYVEFEVKRALEWITGNENKKLASVSLLFLEPFVLRVFDNSVDQIFTVKYFNLGP